MRHRGPKRHGSRNKREVIVGNMGLESVLLLGLSWEASLGLVLVFFSRLLSLVLHGKRKGKKGNYGVVDLLTDTTDHLVSCVRFLFYLLSFCFLAKGFYMLWLWDSRAGAGTSLYNTPCLLANLRLMCLDGMSCSFGFKCSVMGWSDASGTASRVFVILHSTEHSWRWLCLTAQTA